MHQWAWWQWHCPVGSGPQVACEVVRLRYTWNLSSSLPSCTSCEGPSQSAAVTKLRHEAEKHTMSGRESDAQERFVEHVGSDAWKKVYFMMWKFNRDVLRGSFWVQETISTSTDNEALSKQVYSLYLWKLLFMPSYPLSPCVTKSPRLTLISTYARYRTLTRRTRNHITPLCLIF